MLFTSNKSSKLIQIDFIDLPIFSQDFEQIGRGFCETLLDYSDENPNKVLKRRIFLKKIKKMHKLKRAQRKAAKAAAAKSAIVKAFDVQPLVANNDFLTQQTSTHTYTATTYR